MMFLAAGRMPQWKRGITHRRTAYHHPEGNSYIERFHRSLKEEKVSTAEYRGLEEARTSIARWIKEYNNDRPQRGVRNHSPREVFYVDSESASTSPSAISKALANPEKCSRK